MCKAVVLIVNQMYKPLPAVVAIYEAAASGLRVMACQHRASRTRSAIGKPVFW